MSSHPQNHAPPKERVELRTSPGVVQVTSRALFDDRDDADVHSMIERLFLSNAVQAVAIDRRRTKIEIRYDRQAMDMRAALRTFSEALNGTAPGEKAAESNVGTLLRPYLDRLPGRVKRVERRRRPQGAITAASLAGVGIAATAMGRIESLPGTSTSEIVSALPSGRLPESQVVMEDLIVEFDPALEAAAAEGGPLPADISQPWTREVVVGGVRRMVNLAAAGGCFVMSVVGFITPGIPTVPFVLATGYFLARSSPRLHQRFRRSRFFGQMVSDYEDHGGLRRSTKFKMILLTVGLIVVTIVIAGSTLPLLILVGVMGITGIYLLGKIPTVKGSPRPAQATLATV
jgi:uncharacterized membrane protein YbaN (DUF454 family)